MEKSSLHFLFKTAAVFLVAIFIMVSAAAFVPKQFPVGTIVKVEKNTSLSRVADILTEKKVIASPFLFKVAVKLGQGTINAGSYAFTQPQNLWTVVKRLVRGDQGLEKIKVTFPEGSTNEDIAWILLKNIPGFDAPYFVKISKGYEGYLFPDTYFFYSNTSATEAFTALRENFDKQFETLSTDVRLSKRKTADIVIMASMLEREAIHTEDRGVISGILWKRLDEGMPLQVDATLVYLTGDSQVTIAHTKLDSPYNTYKNKGLPIAPISNPGLHALRAAAQAVKSPYYYYLSDAKGKMHYASTFEGHQVNRERYLGK